MQFLTVIRWAGGPHANIRHTIRPNNSAHYKEALSLENCVRGYPACAHCFICKVSLLCTALYARARGAGDDIRRVNEDINSIQIDLMANVVVGNHSGLQ